MCRSGANVAVSYAQACCSNTCQLILTVDNCMSTEQNRFHDIRLRLQQHDHSSVVLSPDPTYCCTPVTLTTVGLFLLSLCPFLVSWWPALSPSTSAAPDMPSLSVVCQTSGISPTVRRLNMKRILPASGLPPFRSSFCLFRIYLQVYVLACFWTTSKQRCWTSSPSNIKNHPNYTNVGYMQN